MVAYLILRQDVYSEPSQTSKMKFFLQCHLRCLIIFWIRLWHTQNDGKLPTDLSQSYFKQRNVQKGRFRKKNWNRKDALYCYSEEIKVQNRAKLGELAISLKRQTWFKTSRKPKWICHLSFSNEDFHAWHNTLK